MCVALPLLLCEISLVNLGNITKSLRILGRDSKEEPLGCRANAFPLDPASSVTHYTSENVGDCRHGLTLQKV